jgi:hypothetical protein
LDDAMEHSTRRIVSAEANIEAWTSRIRAELEHEGLTVNPLENHGLKIRVPGTDDHFTAVPKARRDGTFYEIVEHLAMPPGQETFMGCVLAGLAGSYILSLVDLERMD